MNCKSLIFSIIFICTGSTSIFADEYQRGYSSSKTCTRNEYREEYIPGTRKDPGYVKKWEETVEVPCQVLDQHSITMNSITMIALKAKLQEGF